MSKIQWEYDLVERPFCQQLKTMGWEWIEGDVDVPELTERVNFRQVLLTERLAAALRKINLRDGQPWLDEARLTKAIHDLERSPGHRLLEVNQSATELLLKGTVADGLSDWDHGRPQPLRFIDFEHSLQASLRKLDPGYENQSRVGALALWRHYTSLNQAAKKWDSIVERAVNTRNNTAHGRQMSMSDEEILTLAIELMDIAEALEAERQNRSSYDDDSSMSPVQPK